MEWVIPYLVKRNGIFEIVVIRERLVDQYEYEFKKVPWDAECERWKHCKFSYERRIQLKLNGWALGTVENKGWRNKDFMERYQRNQQNQGKWKSEYWKSEDSIKH